MRSQRLPPTLRAVCQVTANPRWRLRFGESSCSELVAREASPEGETAAWRVEVVAAFVMLRMLADFLEKLTGRTSSTAFRCRSLLALLGRVG
jgi:hypothetical protein